MNAPIVVGDKDDWDGEPPGIEAVSAFDYLTNPSWRQRPGTRIFNLCRSTAYQSHGYYVSLLAEARGHLAVPDAQTLQARQHVNGARPAPLGRPHTGRPRLAILHDPLRAHAPSNAPALERFVDAAAMSGIDARLITPREAAHLCEFDALFIRDTTNVNHYTYPLARTAEQAGMVVLDDSASILRCTNKVFLYELLARHEVPVPRTMIVHRANLREVMPALGRPCVLKLPDGAFSQGVARIESQAQLIDVAQRMLAASDLLLAQEFLPTAFDWRIGILDGRALFACKYYMAPGHWQIIKHDPLHTREGRTEALPLDQVPPLVLGAALDAARLVGDGFYGVDLKQAGNRVWVIEVNDNPNVDAGNEDAVMAQGLYCEVMRVFRRRLRASRDAEVP